MCCIKAVCKGRRKPLAPRAAQRGFTLIELVYATAYFMLGLTGIMMFQVAAADGSAKAGDLMMATTLTANALEILRNTPTAIWVATPTATTYFDRTGAPTSGGGFFTVTTTVAPPTAPITYAEATANTVWMTSSVNRFLHGVTMQTRLGSN